MLPRGAEEEEEVLARTATIREQRAPDGLEGLSDSGAPEGLEAPEACSAREPGLALRQEGLDVHEACSGGP